MRVVILALLLAAVPLSAQTVLNISDSTIEQEMLIIRYDVDHGTSPSAVQIDLSLTSSTPDGVGAQIYPNWDAFVNGTGSFDQDDVSGLGTLNMNSVTASRAGVHPVIVMIGSDFNFSDPAGFSGTITFSVNGVTSPSQGKHTFFVHGLYHQLCGLFADFTTEGATGTTAYHVTVDAGPTVQTFNVRVLTQSTICSRVQLLSGGTELASYTANANGTAVGQGTYAVSGSGTMTFTLQAEGGQPFNYYLGRIFLPSTVSITSVSTGGGGDSKKDKDNGCAAAAGSALPCAPLLYALLWHRRRRLRRNAARPASASAPGIRGAPATATHPSSFLPPPPDL